MSEKGEGETLNFVATNVEFSENGFTLLFSDGRSLYTPYKLIPSLSRATKEQRENVQLLGNGVSLHWPDVNEDLSLKGLVLGRKIIDWQKPVAG